MNVGEPSRIASQLYDVIAALATPITYALFGRAAYIAHVGAPVSFRRFVQECIIIVFMGAVTGGMSAALNFSSPAIAGAFIAATSFYGPKIVIVIVDHWLCKYKIKHKVPCKFDILARQNELPGDAPANKE